MKLKEGFLLKNVAGTNVVISVENMDFDEQGATKITICGKSNTENNSINIKFFDNDGNSTTNSL